MFCFIPRIAAVLLVVVAGTLAPATAGDRPIRASGGGYAPDGQLYASGCEATHLGPSSFGMGLVTEFLPSGILIPFNGYLKSASGDDLNFQFDDSFYSFDPATGIVSATLTFTGGTGRFQDATGSADVMFDFTADFYHFDFLIDGTIDY